MVDQLTLKDADKIMLASRMLDDGTWRATLIVTYHDKKRDPYVGEHPTVFKTSDAAKEWAGKHVAPLLSLVGDKVQADTRRPQGLHCTRYEWVGNDKVYCGKPARYHLSLAPISEDEYCCEEHQQEIRELLPVALHGQLRRIH